MDTRKAPTLATERSKTKHMTVVEPVSEVDPLNDYDETFLECRAINHPWQVVGFYHDHYGGIVRKMRCGRCGTERRDLWTRGGTRMGNRYEYPEGYQIQGHGGISRADVRVATLQRVRVFNSEHEMMSAVVDGPRRSSSNG